MKHKHGTGIGLSTIIFAPPLLALFTPETIGIKIEQATTLDLMTLFYAIAFVWVTLMAFILSDLTQAKRSLRDEKKSHARDINGVFTLLALVSTRQRKKRVIVLPSKEVLSKIALAQKGFVDNSILTNYISLKYLTNNDEYYYYDEAHDHLKSGYKDVFSHWKKIEKLVEEFNKTPSVDSVLEKDLEKTIQEAFNTNSSTHDSIHYYTSQILGWIKNAIDQEDYFDSLEEIRSTTGGKWIIPKGSSVPLITGDNDLDLDKFVKTLKKFVHDKEVKKTYDKEYEKLNKINDEILQFNKKLKFHIKQAKNNPLKGKCGNCPK